MYPIFILFFISLLGIVFMIGRKLVPIRNGKIVEQEEEYVHPFVPDLEKAKHFTYKSIKKYEHLTLVAMLRFYIRATNILKLKYEELKTKIKNRKSRNWKTGESAEENQSNKFLKMIMDYKHRIRHIKTKIEQEEEIK